MGVVSWKDPGSGYDVVQEQAASQETMGQRIRKERKRCGMSQDELGLEVNGVCHVAVSLWESDKCFPEHKNLEKLADVLGVDYCYLLYGADEFISLRGFDPAQKQDIKDYVEAMRQGNKKT